jgi:hypothetical protein
MPRAELGRIPTALLRAAVNDAISRSSFRTVAAESGMSAMGLHRLLSGSEPQARTRAKLEAWYVRDAADRMEPVSAETAAAALRLLAAGLPPEARREAVLAALRTWERAYDAASAPRPAWLTDVKATLK